MKFKKGDILIHREWKDSCIIIGYKRKSNGSFYILKRMTWDETVRVSTDWVDKFFDLDTGAMTNKSFEGDLEWLLDE